MLKNRIKKYLYIFAVINVFALVTFLFENKSNNDIEKISLRNDKQIVDEVEPNISKEKPAKIQNDDLRDSAVQIEHPENIEIESMKIDVPFTAQAPGGNWSDPIFQNGCEEASAVIAMSWVKDRELSPKYVEQEIRNISKLEVEIFGFAVDTDVDDTAKFMKRYYVHANIEVQKNISSDDIKKQLMLGNIMLIPMNGKMLRNPHYTPPGPDEHMLVVVGWNQQVKEFITNDPGTKFGKGYRYSEGVFMDAIWSYPTGSEHGAYPGKENAQKAMIIVRK